MPISTQSTSPMLPTTRALRERGMGVTFAFSKICRAMPLGAGHAVSQMGTIRRKSSVASAIVLPGFSRPIPPKLNCPRTACARLKRNGRMISGSWSRNRKLRGITPMICRGRESTTRLWPIADGSPPNRFCQYPYVSNTVSGDWGVSSSAENGRPSAGGTPRALRVPSFTRSDGTCSASRPPVTATVVGV